MKTEVVLKSDVNNNIKQEWITFNENRSCIEISLALFLSCSDKGFNENRSCIEISCIQC